MASGAVFQRGGVARGHALALAALALVALLAPSPARAQSPLRIAAVLSLSGPNETFGTPALEGIRLALEEANAARGAARIELDAIDDGSDIARGKEIAGRVGGSDAAVVIGPATTPMALAVGALYASSQLVCIGATTTGDSVTDSETFFRAVFSTSDGGEALADYLRYVLGNTRAVVIVKDDGYGRPFAEGFKRAAARDGITARYLSFTTPSEAEAAANAAADEIGRPGIVLGTLTDVVPMVTTLRRRAVEGPILGTNVVAGQFFAAAFANEPEERARPGYFTNGIYAATPLLFDSATAETLAFAARFRARFGHEASYITAQGFEAAQLAIAAVRAAAAQAKSVAEQRRLVRAYLASLDGPAHALPGLEAPLWFTPGRGRIQPLRIGQFHGTTFESAPGQLVPVAHPDASEIAGGTVIELRPGRYARRQQVVYTGLYLNELSRIDMVQSTFTADFYLWMRFARGADTGIAIPTAIDFPTMVRGTFDSRRLAAEGDLDDGTTYRLWQVRGDFKNDFDLHRYPADRQTLELRFFNARAASDRIVYVLDQRSFANVPVPDDEAEAEGARDAPTAEAAAPLKDKSFATAVAPAAFRNLTQWKPIRTQERRDSLVTASALGDPRLVGLERRRELSGFSLLVDVQRRVGTTLAKTLLPLGLMALIMFASLYFPAALVKEKVTVAITGALSGAVLLSSINSQLGNVGYVIALEYGFYAFFVLCLLCIVSVLVAERMRAAAQPGRAVAVEQSSRLLFLVGLVGTVAVAWVTIGW